MKKLKAQIKALNNELQEKKIELSETVEAIKTEVGKPGMLLKGFLVGIALGYLLLPRKNPQPPIGLAHNTDVPNLPAPASFRDHLDVALRQHFPSNNLLVNAAKILKFL